MGKGKVVVESTNLAQFIGVEEAREKAKEEAKSSKAAEVVVVNPCKQKLEQMLKTYSSEAKEE